MIEVAIEIGAKVGRVPVDEVLPDPTTISRNLERRVENLQSDMKREIEEVCFSLLCSANISCTGCPHEK